MASSNPIVKEFDELLSHSLAAFVTRSSEIGGEVDHQAKLMEKCFQAQRKFIALAATHSKPGDTDLNEILKTCLEPVGEVVNFKDAHRSSAYFNHLCAVAESIAALGWISLPKPVPYIKEMQDAGQFFINRVLKEYKTKDPKHITWTQDLSTLWKSLSDYVKQHHTTGVSWCAQGPPAKASDMKSSSTAAGAPPPPPPPPPPMPLQSSQPKEPEDDSVDRSALFAQLNRGEAVTAGLRKVTDDMKTHKNPKLRGAPPIQPQKAAPAKPPKPGKLINAPKKSSGSLELNGNKWIVENFENEQLTLDKTEQKQSVYVYKCTRCTVIIKGKINSISVDNCKKTGVLFDNLISSLDVVNCQSVSVQVAETWLQQMSEIQALNIDIKVKSKVDEVHRRQLTSDNMTTGVLQTVNVDKTDGCQIYLSKQSQSADVITAKCSGVNILIPKDDGDFDEYPVPEQFKTNFTGKGLVTKCNESI